MDGRLRGTCFVLLSCLVIVSGTRAFSPADTSSSSPPPTPVFATNYRVEGLLSLPYAELNEPFSAWYDKKTGRSRTDYYGDTYQIYQFGPQSAPDQGDRQYGAMYKLVYVPSDFHQATNHESLLGRVRQAFDKASETVTSPLRSSLPASLSSLSHNKQRSRSQTRRACFSVKGGVGFTIGPQTVLPNLVDFTYDSTGDCPHTSLEHWHKKCELWKLVNNVGDKRNTYKVWVARNASSQTVVPVHMLGYDSLLGSHYDRYDVTYRNFRANGAGDADFLLNQTSTKDCGPMPGPGDDSSDTRQRRSHMIMQNPMHEFVVEPHIYDHVDHEFEQFAKEHDVEYENQKQHRLSWHNFLHNFRFVNGKNRELKEYKLKLNRFADNNVRDLAYLRGRLYSKGYNGGLDYEQAHNLRGKRRGGDAGATLKELPKNWDWNLRGAVTPVKDQAVCGSCWSFGTSGTLEGAYFVKTGKLPKLSQQQMVDCSWKYGNNGCDGGEDFRAYKYIMDAGGLATEEDYGDYMGIDGKCHDRDVKKTVKISGFYNVTANDPEALKHALVNYGPITVAIDASRPTFTFYWHGVYYDEKCNSSPDGLDHQVLVTGYTELDGKFVWVVKNSWSTYWGNNGYIMMSAEKNNCGVMDAPYCTDIIVV